MKIKKRPSFQKFDIKGQFEKDKNINKNLLVLSFCSLGLSLTSVIFVLIFYNKLPPQVPLFYGLARGSQQIVPKLYLVIPAVAAILITAINYFINLLFADKFIKQSLIGTSLLASLFALVAVIKIYILVGI